MGMGNSEFVKNVSAMAGENAQLKRDLAEARALIEVMREALAVHCEHANMFMRGTNVVCPDCQTVQSML